MLCFIWASLRENLSLGFLIRSFPKQPPQLQRLARKFNCPNGKFRYDTFQLANINGADQTVRMGRLVCAFVVHKPRKQVYSRRGPYEGDVYRFLMKGQYFLPFHHSLFLKVFICRFPVHKSIITKCYTSPKHSSLLTCAL